MKTIEISERQKNNQKKKNSQDCCRIAAVSCRLRAQSTQRFLHRCFGQYIQEEIPSPLTTPAPPLEASICLLSCVVPFLIPSVWREAEDAADGNSNTWKAFKPHLKQYMSVPYEGSSMILRTNTSSSVRALLLRSQADCNGFSAYIPKVLAAWMLNRKPIDPVCVVCMPSGGMSPNRVMKGNSPFAKQK